MGKQIKIGAVISYLTLFINTLITLIYLPWMVSVIGKKNYALYTLATTLISIFMVDFGLSSAVSRFIAKYNAEGQESKVNEFVGTVESLYVIIGACIFTILFIFYFFLDRVYAGLSADEIGTFKSLYIIVASYSIISFPCMPFSGILNAYEKFIQLKLCDLSQKILATFLTIGCLFLGGGVREVVLCNAVSGVIAIICRLLIIKFNTSIKIHLGSFERDMLKSIFSFSIWITVISLAQRCIYNIAPSILGIVSDSEAIAIFAPANTLESFFFMLASAVNGLFLPTISRYIAEDDNNKIYKLMVKVGRYQFILLSLVFVGFFCVGEEFMIAWMGQDFVKSYPCVLLLFFPDILLFTQQIANTTALVKNIVKQQAWGYIGMAVICVGTSFLLCGKLGAMGSAIAISLSYLFLFAYLSILYKKELNIDIIRFFNDCYWDLGIPILVAAGISYVISRLVSFDMLWISIMVKATITIVVFGLCIVFKLNSEEKSYIKRVIKRMKLIK